LREKKQRYFRRRRECKSPSSSGFLVVAVGELAVMGRPPASTAKSNAFWRYLRFGIDRGA
jgi:hypothetical protein